MQLDNTAKAALIRQLLPLADDYDQWRVQLIAAGFDAFTVWETFYDSFAENESELALHHKIVRERAKRRFADPYLGEWLRNDEGYISPYDASWLDELIARKKQQLIAEGRQDRMDYAAGDIDPCAERRSLRWHADPVAEWPRQKQAKIAFYEKREAEARRFTTGLTCSEPGNEKAVFEVVHDYAATLLASLGFERSKKLSTKAWPIFAKPMADDWFLTLAVRGQGWRLTDFSGLLMPDGELFPTPRCFDVFLELRRLGAKGPLKDANDGLPIRFDTISPLGSGSQYGSYFKLSHIEAALQGYVYLYKLMSARLETTIGDFLKAIARNPE